MDMMNQNQQENFMRLWTSSQPSVAAYIHSLVRDRAAAEDLLQETALLLFQRFAEYDETRPFVAWALGFARFKVMGLRRDAGRSLLVFDDEALENFTETWAEETDGMTDRGAALEGCIGQLADKARRIVRLRYFEGLSAVQIAAKLGGNQGAIRVALQRIREQLRECVERNLRTEGTTV
jgi:RNA polymerase sigma-70 factor, ECF subfamily